MYYIWYTYIIESESSLLTLTENTRSSSILSIFELETPYWINLHIIFKYISYTSIRILIDYSYYYQVYSIIHRILQSRLWIGLIKESHDIEYKNIQIRIDLLLILINKRLVLERRLLLLHIHSLSTYESINTISYILFFSIH